MNTQQMWTSQQIISALQAMPFEELENLVESALSVRAERIAPHLTVEETRLLKIIELTLPVDDWERMKVLQTNRDNGCLSLDDYAELAELIEKLEEIHAGRLRAAALLADLQGVTFQTILNRLGIITPV